MDGRPCEWAAYLKTPANSAVMRKTEVCLKTPAKKEVYLKTPANSAVIRKTAGRVKA